MRGFHRWLRRRAGRRYCAPSAGWWHAEAALPVLRRLDSGMRSRLEAVAGAFLAEKRLEGVAGAELDEPARAAIALQAAVPVCELGVDWYAPWTTVLIYPAGFKATHEYEDEAGVVHRETRPLIGEAWEGGPLVLSLEDALSPEPGTSVVIHECAHKLDMRQGAVNGLPPLRPGMRLTDWSHAFEQAYRGLGGYYAEGEAAPGSLSGAVPPLDPEAAEDPGELFAVASETFFAAPERLREAYPAVYQQLAQFYGWRPA